MEDKIRFIMNKFIALGATPGINYAVINDKNKIVGSLGLKSKYDMKDNKIIEKEEKNNIDTVYDIASLTKVVCIVPIIFRMYEKGLINLNDNVKKYLNQFKYDDITIYDLLTHTSGLEADVRSKDIVSKDEIIKKIYSAERKTDKGNFLYSDVGYIILGFIIEKVYDMSLDKVFIEEVAIPLDMKNTRFNPINKEIIAPTEITEKRGVLRGTVHDEKAASLDGIAGNAGLFSNINDLINYCTMIMNGGIFNGKKYLDKSTIDMWFTPLAIDRKYNRSFCWFVGDNPNVLEGKNVISFTGFTGPSICIDMENKMSIITLTNRVHPTRDNRLNTIMRSKILGEIYNINNKDMLSKEENSYDASKEAFDKYIEECRRRIKDTFFKKDYLLEYYEVKDNLVKSNKISPNSSVSDAIKYERLQMIDIKINHTMRVVNDVMKIADKLGTNVDFNNILKISALLHDIGRFDQATWNSSFSDACYSDIEGINNHAHAGYHILFVNDRIKDFNISKRFYKAIGSVVYNHADTKLTGYLAQRIQNVNQLDMGKLKGEENLNDCEKIIIAALVQMVRDVDMLDILYQHLTGEFPVIREYINFDICGDTIYDIAKYWEMDPSDILKYNGIKAEDLKLMKKIKIPVDKINLKKLSVPKDIQDKFFNNEDIDLREIMQRRDFTFITGMWWRLNHFLNNISFTSNLQLIEEKKLLEKIYNQYPVEYKFLVKDAFEYAQTKLIELPIKNSGSSIYTNVNSDISKIK